MEKSGEKKANVAILKGQRQRERERERGREGKEGVDGKEAEKREGKLFVGESEEASQHD